MEPKETRKFNIRSGMNIVTRRFGNRPEKLAREVQSELDEAQVEEKIKKKKKMLWLILILMLVIFVVGTIFGTAAYFKYKSELIPDYDGTIMNGSLKTNDPEEIRRMLQDKVDESQFTFKINARPAFSSDINKGGNIRIENPPSNIYNTVVSIKIDDTDEEVFKSPLLKPAQYIEYGKLTKKLKSGTYDATAIFSAYHPETNRYMGEVHVDIKMTVY